MKQLPRSVEKAIKEQEKFKEASPILDNIIFLFIVLIIGAIIIAAIMLFLLKVEHCPLCGGKIIKDYEGKNFVSYKCTKCKYYRHKMKKGVQKKT